MKTRYLCFIVIVVVIYFVLFFLLKTYLPFSGWITASATLGGTFAAIITAIIALGIADKPPKVVKFTLNIKVNKNSYSYYGFDQLSLTAMQQLLESGKEFSPSYQVYFNIKNISGLTLNKPVVTFELPKELRHPDGWRKEVEYVNPTYHSNLFNVAVDVRQFEYEDKIVLSNNILPYLNDKQELPIWIRMCLSQDDKSEYPVKLSLNCDNAEGKTMTETIIPSKLLEGIDKSKKEGG